MPFSAITHVDVGSYALRGKADRIPVGSVRAVVAAMRGAQRADGLEAPLVGRDRELRLFKELFHPCVEETGAPALLVLDGEAGAGTTRLAWSSRSTSKVSPWRRVGTADGASPTAKGSPSTPWPKPCAAA
ncbi:MAG: ATP-binding protein [Actinomycetota bacterium]|nr:ATP-binding protein [Actinomycetota bacterium]